MAAAKNTYVVNNVHPEKPEITEQELTKAVYRVLLGQHNVQKSEKTTEK